MVNIEFKENIRKNQKNNLIILFEKIVNIMKQQILFKKYLKKSNKLLNYDWINILATDLYPQIIYFRIKILHDFFNVLAKENQMENFCY